MTVTLEAAKQDVAELDTYVLEEEGGEFVCALRDMDPDEIRQAIRQLMREASGILGHADVLATWAADRFPGEDFSRIIPCLSIGLPVKDPEHPLPAVICRAMLCGWRENDTELPACRRWPLSAAPRLTARRRRVRQRGGHRGRRLHGTRLCRILGLMSPEIALTNQVRWRIAIVDRRMKEAVELLREAAAAPGYTGPPLDVVERMAGVIGEIRDQVKNWSLDEQIRRASRLRIIARNKANGGGRRRRTLADLYR